MGVIILECSPGAVPVLESDPWDHFPNPTEVILSQTDDLSLSRVVLAIKKSLSWNACLDWAHWKKKWKEGAAKLVLILMLA